MSVFVHVCLVGVGGMGVCPETQWQKDQEHLRNEEEK